MPRSLGRLCLAALTVTMMVAVGGWAAAPASAAIVTVTSGAAKALFLQPSLDPVPESAYATPDPDKNGPQFTAYQTTGIRDEIDDLVQQASTGSTLYASLYTFSDSAIADHLITAHQRGVRVRLLIEACPGDPPSCGPSSQVTKLVSALGSYAPGATGSWTFQCQASCSGGNIGINHSKFWVFGNLSDGRTDVTLFGSANPTKPQQQMFQNMVEVSGNATLAAGFRSYVTRKVDNYGSTKVYETGHLDAGAYRVWFSPRNSPSTGEDSEITSSFSPQSVRHDIFAAAIDDIQCSTTTSDDVIRMAMWTVRTARPEVIDALGDKRDAGCTVEVITGEHQDAMTGLAARGIAVRSTNAGGCRQSFFAVGSDDNAECSDGGVHSKYLLTEGISRRDNKRHSYVYTGSHNLTNGALKKNDEVLARIEDATLYSGYVSDFTAIRNATIRIAPSRYPNATFSTANAVATGDQHEAAAASGTDATGGHVSLVAFSSGTRGGLNNEIRLGRFLNGVRQSEVVVQTGGTSTNWNYRTPSVGLAANGDAVVVWADDGNGNGGYEIRARRVRPDGTMSAVVNVNAVSDGDQSTPSVGVMPDGRFGVAWQDMSTAGRSTIRYAGFSASNGRISPIGTDGYDVPVQAITGGTYRKPSLAVNATGTVATAWEDDSDGNGGYSIRGSVGTITGGFSPMIAVHSGSLSDGQQYDPVVGIAVSGSWYVAWTDAYSGRTGADGNPQSLIYVRGFSGTSATFAARPISGPIYRWSVDGNGDYQVATQTPYQSDRVGRQSRPDLAVDGHGNAVVVWQESGQSTGLTSASSGADIWARGIGPNGTTDNLFPEYRLSVYTANAQDEPAISADDDGTLTAFYADDWEGNGGTQLRIRHGLRNCAQVC